MDYMIIPRDTEERLLLDLFNDMPWMEREHLLEYAKKLAKKAQTQSCSRNVPESKKKIAEFCDVEVFMDESFNGAPSVDINYMDDDVYGRIDLTTGRISGDFSKYVLPVIEAWFREHKDILVSMWDNKRIELVPAWE